MKLERLLEEKREAVVERWYDEMLATYPPETAKLWKRNKNQFTNPVGNTYVQAMNGLAGEIVTWSDADKICAYLEEVIKIRSVQDFTPGKALSFIFLFKKVIREQFAAEIKAQDLRDELETIDRRVDNMALMCFDIYTRCREQLYDMKVKEFKRAHHMLFKRAGIKCEDPDLRDLGESNLGSA